MIRVNFLDFPYIEEQDVEIVERKGIGHPDTICDNISEKFSIELSKYYYENFGRIFHHNVDKAVLIGGKAIPKFGGGEVLEPIEIKVVGRAILEIKDKKIPIEEIYNESAKKFLENNFKHLNINKHIKLSLKIRPGSVDLVELFNSYNQIPKSNDTSFGVGYAPFSKLENLVYQIESFLFNLREIYPFIGEDIKVMGVRINRKITITIALAFIDKYFKDVNDYLQKKSLLKEKILSEISKNIDDEIEIHINTADIPDKDIVYITVTGTSAEAGDDGQVGRGNRINGLITPYRPMSLEAPAGKNPISHVGKLYNIIANRIANDVVNNFEEISEAYVYIVSQIGKPINEPQVLDIKIRTKQDNLKIFENEIRKIAQKHLEELPSLWKEILEGKVAIC
ncbi:MAG: methionine adenosyltransferase [Candidatus Hydrothermia bacterium]|jgi:S-adenosylmethionine synthetase